VITVGTEICMRVDKVMNACLSTLPIHVPDAHDRNMWTTRNFQI